MGYILSMRDYLDRSKILKAVTSSDSLQIMPHDPTSDAPGPDLASATTSRHHVLRDTIGRIIGSSRLVVLLAVIGSFVAAVSLLIYEFSVVASLVIDMLMTRDLSPKAAKAFAVGMIEAVDVFLIGIALYMISLGFHVLFVDPTLPVPRWLKFRDLDDLKSNLVSVVVAVLAVMFLRQAIATYADVPFLTFSASVALMIVALTFFLGKVQKKE